MVPNLNLKIEFGGGLELLFSNQPLYNISIPAIVSEPNTHNDPISKTPQSASGFVIQRPADVTFLLHWLKDNLLLKEREELSMEGNFVLVFTRIHAWALYSIVPSILISQST